MENRLWGGAIIPEAMQSLACLPFVASPFPLLCVIYRRSYCPQGVSIPRSLSNSMKILNCFILGWPRLSFLQKAQSWPAQDKAIQYFHTVAQASGNADALGTIRPPIYYAQQGEWACHERQASKALHCLWYNSPSPQPVFHSCST